MCRLVWSYVLGFSLILSPIQAASVWTPIASQLELSVVRIDVHREGSRSGHCTGFVINAEKNYVLTAAHCDGEKLLVDGAPAYRIFIEEQKDIMVLQVPGVEGGVAVTLAKRDPKRGDEVASFGYGLGLEDPVFRIAHVSNTGLNIEGLSGPFILVDSAFVGGQSGGPVVNTRGEVVMIVQRGSDGFGLGIGVEIIRSKIRRYLPA